ncbi:TetR family transcriptional regulator [Actinomycetospora sp. NBRC 106378]|uniref:TetR/AcrR family transcriptional regulator n=1 Tax=Actinomycetospora sp. NBRC 106378 TaxID=3032208 RepID=UPI00249FD8AC|nr:TetR family transcriptional regulator [Actinomycetospora sp. NBRC 106378]GLZ53390.1 TetR family transcriptional regulator [Actinomycetospora sp. NBRC 106378]
MPPPPTPSSEGTGRGAKSARTRRRVVDAAAHVLVRRGYAGTRLSDVAEVAQVQAPAIYYYFSSRDELIEEAVAVGLARARTLVEEALAEANGSPLDRLRVAVAAHLSTLLTHSDHARGAIRTVPQLPESMRARHRQAERDYIDIWRGLVADARAAGEIDRDLEPGVALMVVLGALNWTAEWWDPERGSLEGVIATAQRLVVDGLSADRS